MPWRGRGSFIMAEIVLSSRDWQTFSRLIRISFWICWLFVNVSPFPVVSKQDWSITSSVIERSKCLASNWVLMPLWTNFVSFCSYSSVSTSLATWNWRASNMTWSSKKPENFMLVTSCFILHRGSLTNLSRSFKKAYSFIYLGLRY